MFKLKVIQFLLHVSILTLLVVFAIFAISSKGFHLSWQNIVFSFTEFSELHPPMSSSTSVRNILFVHGDFSALKTSAKKKSSKI